MAAPDRERRHRLEELFLEVLDLDDEARRARLEDEDPELSGEVRHWLAAFRRADPWLEEGALAVVPELEARLRTATPGRRIGPYRILTELGRGGMGAVYLAERDDPTFPQRVALKLIKRGMDSEQIVRRFLVERRILAGLIHPSIARLLDGGSTDDGRPYFVLEYVAGEPITTFVRERRLALEARLRLVLEVCRAVQYAHQKLIVHRDLKPANILVDPRGSP
ncbi:MAG: protein kinase, partial [Holophagales bacterium]|nr:protein kinase [Holophagales bacterium]